MNYPQYVSHKKVSAVKIASVDPGADGSLTLHLEGGFDNVVIPHDEAKHKPRPIGGFYLVVYEGGYRSFSPADVFESGYAPLTDDAPQASKEETDPEVEDAQNNHGQGEPNANAAQTEQSKADGDEPEHAQDSAKVEQQEHVADPA